MECEEICKRFWKDGDHDVCERCQPFMRALLVNVCKGQGGVPASEESNSYPAPTDASVQKVVNLDDEDTMIDKLEWNNLVTAMDAVGKSGIPKEQAETIEIILTEIKKRGTL